MSSMFGRASIFDYVSTDGVATDIYTTSTHAHAKWREACAQIDVFSSTGELMDLVMRKRDVQAMIVVACLCS